MPGGGGEKHLPADKYYTCSAKLAQTSQDYVKYTKNLP